MKLSSIHLTNYRMHADLTVDFGPGFNVIVGVNGSGKTTLLKGVCEALNGLLWGVVHQHQIQPLEEPGIARLLTVGSAGRVRFESQFPVQVQARGTVLGQPCQWGWDKTSPIAEPQRFGQYIGDHVQQVRQIFDHTTNPLILFYRANRHWNSPESALLQAATQKQSRSDAYASWSDASLDAAGLQTWAISKCLERYQTSSETGIAFDAIQDDELALVNAALSAAVEGAKGLRYDMKQKSLLVEWQDTDGTTPRDPTTFDQLSDGQRAVIGLVADIARRMCLLNPQLGDAVTTQTPGVVLIDELDMHLHPKWQRLITTGLKAAFPAIQFIVASHSPQVLGELRPEEIILLRPEGTAHPQVSYGLDSSRVLEEIMGATARTPDIESALENLFAALERNELPSARTQLEQLKMQAPGIAELGGAQALLKRKEMLGR